MGGDTGPAGGNGDRSGPVPHAGLRRPSFPLPGRTPVATSRLGNNHNGECRSLTSATINASAPRRVAFAGAGGHRTGAKRLLRMPLLLIPPALVAEHAPERLDGRCLDAIASLPKSGPRFICRIDRDSVWHLTTQQCLAGVHGVALPFDTSSAGRASQSQPRSVANCFAVHHGSKSWLV